MEENKLTEEELDKKVENLKERFKQHIIKKAYVTNSTYSNEEIDRHRVKKAKSRKRGKIQKQSRKKNR